MASRGRPRSFDREEALRSALLLFRRYGYEGATLADLQAAMGGITAPSFYAAFGSKEELFREAVDLYRATVGARNASALVAQPTARASIEAMLIEAVRSFCRPGEPRGCLLVLGALNCSQGNEGVQKHMSSLRLRTQQAITDRLERGAAEGDIAASVDIAALASFYATFIHGLSIQARDGASRGALIAAVQCAMAAWDRLAGD